MRTFSTPLLTALLVGLGLCTSAMAQKAEVIHWWTSGGESAAIKQFAEAYNKANAAASAADADARAPLAMPPPRPSDGVFVRFAQPVWCSASLLPPQQQQKRRQS